MSSAFEAVPVAVRIHKIGNFGALKSRRQSDIFSVAKITSVITKSTASYSHYTVTARTVIVELM